MIQGRKEFPASERSNRRFVNRPFLSGARLLIGALLLLVLLLAQPATAAAQGLDFSVPELKMEVYVQPDASARIIYDITFANSPVGGTIDIVDIATSWAAKFILKMTTLGLIDVYPNHEFQPKKILNRAEMAEILVRLIMHLDEKGHKFIQQIPLDRIQIADVTPSNFYYQPILTIVSYDIMSLFSDRTFKPDTPISGRDTIRLFDIILALIE